MTCFGDCIIVDLKIHLAVQFTYLVNKWNNFFQDILTDHYFFNTGLKHTEAVVYALVEILNSLLFYQINSGYPHSEIDIISKHYISILECEDVAVSYTAKTAISRSLKPLVFVKNKHNLVPGDDLCKESMEG